MHTLQRTGWWSERGRRPANEDAALSLSLGVDAEVVAVADGMGGHAAGEVASRAALDALAAALRSGAPLREAVFEAHEAVRALALDDPDRTGMGTTLVALLRRGERYEIANVGDSRAYRLDAAGLRQLTEDHSFVAEVVRRGDMSPEEAERSPWKSALTRAVGGEAELEVDVFGPFDAAEPHAVLLCTDGVYRVVGDEDLAAALGGAGDAEAAARSLTGAALQAGSEDNVTAAVLAFGGWGEETVAGTPAEATAPWLASAAPEPALMAGIRAATQPAAEHRAPEAAPAAPARWPTSAPDHDPARRHHSARRSRAVWRWRMLEGMVFLIAVLLVLGLLVGLVFFMH